MMDALLTELNRSDLAVVDAPALAHQLQTLKLIQLLGK